jgi:CRISPR-associated protein Csc2
MNTNTIAEELEDGTVDEMQNTRQNRFTHILVLREVTAPARFTTDGETVNTMRIRTGDPESSTVSTRVVDLFYRKQPGAERRVAKSIQRDLLEDDDDCSDDYMDPNDMNQNSVESVLFGSAAGDQGISQRSRVYYNSAYSLRSAEATIQQNTQTAAGDEIREDADEGQGTWTPDFVKPGTLFPSVITLDSATPEEVMFVLAVIGRTTRYGKSTSRGGNVRNHLLGIRMGNADGPANLEVTRLTAGLLAGGDTDSGGTSYDEADLREVITGDPHDPAAVGDTIKMGYDTLLERRGIEMTKIDQDRAQEALQALQDDDQLQDVLESQLKKTQDYVTTVSGGD